MGSTPMHPGIIWRDIIKHARVTGTWVAGQMGISEKHLSNILVGRHLPSAAHTVAFAQVMKANARALYLAQADYEIRKAIEDFEPPAQREVPPAPGRWSGDADVEHP